MKTSFWDDLQDYTCDATSGFKSEQIFTSWVFFSVIVQKGHFYFSDNHQVSLIKWLLLSFHQPSRLPSGGVLPSLSYPNKFILHYENLKNCVQFVSYHLFQVPVASWFDDMNDRELLDLIPFLENLSKVESVYTILQQAKDPNKSGSLVPLPVAMTSSHATPNSTSPITSVTPEMNSSTLKVNKSSSATVAVSSSSATPNNTSWFFSLWNSDFVAD